MDNHKKKVPRGVSKNGFPITASVTSHWSTPAITLGLVRTMKSHQASIHQGQWPLTTMILSAVMTICGSLKPVR